MNLRTKSGFVLREVGEGTVLVPTGERVVDMNGMVILNDTAKFIWERLDGTRSAHSIAAELEEAFDVTADQASEDVTDFLAELERLGMLETEDAAD